MNTAELVLFSPITWDIVGAVIILLLVWAVVAIVRRPFAALVAKVMPVAPSTQVPTQPAQNLDVDPPKLGGMNAAIAFTHRTVSQIIGLEMSSANLLAVFLSVTCAVAGAFILAYTYYQSFFVPGIAALAMLVLAILIENITLSSLKSIRLANVEIQKQDDEYYDTLNKQLNDQLTAKATKLAEQQAPLAMTKEEARNRQRAHKQEQREQRELINQKHNLVKQRTRRVRRDRNASIPFAAVGICFSAVAGGLFWHQVLAGLDIRLNIAISAMFALAVSVTFILSELFKRVQDEAIKEAMGTNELQQEMLKQQADDISMETMIETMNAVRVDPVAKLEMRNAMKLEFVKMIKLSSQESTKRLLARGGSVSPAMTNTVESDETHSVPNTVVVSQEILEEVRETVVASETAQETVAKQEVREPVQEPTLAVAPAKETPIAKTVSPKIPNLGFVEKIMYNKLIENFILLTDLVSFSKTASLQDLVSHLQSRFSSHASFLTEERVENVMFAVKQNYPDLFEETASETPASENAGIAGERFAETDQYEAVSPLVPQRARITVRLAPLPGETDNETDDHKEETVAKHERNTDKLHPVVKKASFVSRITSKKVASGETEVVAKMRTLLNKNPNMDPMELAKKAKVTPQYARKIRKSILAEISA